MKLELTNKDILLLKLACSALIAFFIIRFLVMPGISRLQENTIQDEALDETIQKIETAIDNIPAMETAVENRLKDLAEISEPYYEHMENREVDELLTGLALKHGLFPVSLSIDGAAAAIPEPYLYGQILENAGTGSGNMDSMSDGTDIGLGNIDSAQDAAGTAPGNTGSALENAQAALESAGEEPGSAGTLPEGGQVVSENYILTAVGHMVLQGDETKFFAFLDDVEDNYPAVKLRFLRRDEKLYFDEEWNMTKQPDMSIDLAVYMYDLTSVGEGNELAHSTNGE